MKKAKEKPPDQSKRLEAMNNNQNKNQEYLLVY
jgi:hypothetical protein